MNKKILPYINEYSLSLTKLCNSLCCNSHDAQDLFQSTWEKAIRNFKRYNPEKSFEKWLFTICVNTYRDMLKRFDNKKVLCFKTTEEKEKFLGAVSDNVAEKDDYIALHSALKKLKPEHREVLVLHYFRDYPIKELASILSIPEGTVKSRLHLAREQMKKEMSIDE
ncbi:MAG: sigma-70 family RNA polymerase sigma factor [Ruminococcus sp.]|nr:sigma-70 family RNA polymerase sigma factor [Ruminococcus sp.]